VPEATSLLLCGAQTLGQTRLLVAGLQGFADRLDGLTSARGIEALAGQYTDVCATLGRRVRVERAGAPTVVGTAVALTDDAALVIRPEGGGPDVTLAAGDVTHLRNQRPNVRR